MTLKNFISLMLGIGFICTFAAHATTADDTAPEFGVCQSVNNLVSHHYELKCGRPWNKPVIITHGAVVELKALHRNEDIHYLVFSGKGDGIAKINTQQRHLAGRSSPLVYVYTSPKLISTARYYQNRCDSDTILSTYNVETGQAYQAKDIITDMTALRHALKDEYLKYEELDISHYENYSENEKAARLIWVQNMIEALTAKEKFADAGIYVEDGRVFINLGFVDSCVGGSFNPVEVPANLIDPDFMKLLTIPQHAGPAQLP